MKDKVITKESIEQYNTMRDLLEHMSRVYCKHYGFNPDQKNLMGKVFWKVFAERFKRLAEALSANGYILIKKSTRDDMDADSRAHQESQHAKYGPGGTHTDMGQ